MVEEKTTIIILMIFYPYFAKRITQAAFAWQERAQFMLQLRIAGGLVRRLRPGGRLSSASLLTRLPGPSGRGRLFSLCCSFCCSRIEDFTILLG
ncbi:MAG: hypothetical protein HPY61_08645 [Methanotrichaceae archaeon]|nr:hypothetical protein [Methanotrichaceae archaeon]